MKVPTPKDRKKQHEINKQILSILKDGAARELESKFLTEDRRKTLNYLLTQKDISGTGCFKYWKPTPETLSILRKEQLIGDELILFKNSFSCMKYPRSKYSYLKEKFWHEHKFLNIRQVAALWSPDEQPSEIWDTDEIESAIKDKDVYSGNLRKIELALSNEDLKGIPGKLSKVELAAWADKKRVIPTFLLSVPEFKNKHKKGGNWLTVYSHEKQLLKKIQKLEQEYAQWDQSSSTDIKDLALREKKLSELSNQIQELKHSKSLTSSTTSDSVFSTPVDMTWQDIAFKLEDGHTAVISYGGKQYKRSYEELGFANTRNHLPIKLWDFFIIFVVLEGKVNRTEEISKKVSDLNKHLRKRFPLLDGKPIRKNNIEVGYVPVVNFSINHNHFSEVINKLREENEETKEKTQHDRMIKSFENKGSDENLYGIKEKKEEDY